MVAVLLISVVGVIVGVGLIAGVIVLLVRLTDAPGPAPYVPHAWPEPSGPIGAPGWYPDHSDARLLRYFDGQRWTAATRPR